MFFLLRKKWRLSVFENKKKIQKDITLKQGAIKGFLILMIAADINTVGFS